MACEGVLLDISLVEEHKENHKKAIELLRISDNKYLGSRESELSQLLEFLHGCIKDKAGRSMFVFGLSGTGKTTTVEHAVDVCLKENKGVKSIYMSGSSYDNCKGFILDLFQKLLRYTPEKSHKLLKMAFSDRQLDYRKLCILLTSLFRTVPDSFVCLIDEVDYMRHFTVIGSMRNDSNWLLQALFKAANDKNSKVIILAISNHLELATKLTTNNCKILLFKPYTADQMVNIVMEKLKTLNTSTSSILNKTALLLLARRVANTSGDCRACLDSFIRALSQSLTKLDRETVEAIDTKTPERIKLDDYVIGYQEIKSITPTLSMTKKDQLEKQLSNFPVLQLLLLLSSCKAYIQSDKSGDLITSTAIKKCFLELGEILLMDSNDVESFCNAEYNSSIDTFCQLSIIAKDDDVITFKTDAIQLANLILDMSPAFTGLDFHDDIENTESLLTKRYGNLSKSFNISCNNPNKKIKRNKLFWTRG